nr:hypothetical protein CFP56_03555 [Quercus suber]
MLSNVMQLKKYPHKIQDYLFSWLTHTLTYFFSRTFAQPDLSPKLALYGKSVESTQLTCPTKTYYIA